MKELNIEDLICLIEARERYNTLVEFEIETTEDLEDVRRYAETRESQKIDLSEVPLDETIDVVDDIIDKASKSLQDKINMWYYIDDRTKMMAELICVYQKTWYDVYRFYDYLTNDFVEDFVKWNPQEVYCTAQAYDKEKKEFVDVDCSPRQYAEDLLADCIGEFDILMSNNEYWGGYTIDCEFFEDDILQGLAKSLYQPIIDMGKKHHIECIIEDEAYEETMGKRLEH